MSFLNGLAEIFRDSALSALGAGFQAMEDPQSFLRDDLPSDASSEAKWIQSRNRRACRQHARNEAAGLYSDLGALRRPRYERVCRPYLDSINEGPTSEGSYGPPFTGGQCSNRNYEVFAVMNIGSGLPGDCTTFPNRRITPVGGVIGPIRGIRYGSGFATDGVTPVQTAVLLHGQNQEFDLGARFLGCPLPYYSDISVVAQGSGPDNCGNPPGEYTPPGYPTNLPPIGPPDTDNPPPGGDGEDDVEVDPDGNIRICENGDCSSPTSPGGGGDPSEDPGEEDGGPQENDPNNPGDDDITGCASEGQILTGIKIEITQTPPAEVPGAGGLYRKVCWVWMGPRQDQLDLVVDGRYLEDGQFVIPDSNNCRCYKVRPSPLWGLRVQAYSRPEKED